MMSENILIMIAHFREASGGGGGAAPLCIITIYGPLRNKRTYKGALAVFTTYQEASSCGETLRLGRIWFERLALTK